MIVVPEISASTTVWSQDAVDPVALARRWRAQGASSFVLSDPLAAAEGWDRIQQLAEVPAAVDVPVYLNAGLADSKSLDRVGRLGFAGFVLPASVLGDPALVRWGLDMVGARLAVELQIEGDRVIVPGREQSTTLPVVDAAGDLARLGVEQIFIRDLGGAELPFNLLRLLCDSVHIQFAFAGSVRSAADIALLSSLHLPNLRAVLVGPELLDGGLDFSDAAHAA